MENSEAIESLKELTNVTFDEIKVGATDELAITLKQNQIDVAAMVSGSVDGIYLKEASARDTRQEPRNKEAAGRQV